MVGGNDDALKPQKLVDFSYDKTEAPDVHQRKFWLIHATCDGCFAELPFSSQNAIQGKLAIIRIGHPGQPLAGLCYHVCLTL